MYWLKGKRAVQGTKAEVIEKRVSKDLDKLFVLDPMLALQLVQIKNRKFTARFER